MQRLQVAALLIPGVVLAEWGQLQAGSSRHRFESTGCEGAGHLNVLAARIGEDCRPFGVEILKIDGRDRELEITCTAEESDADARGECVACAAQQAVTVGLVELDSSHEAQLCQVVPEVTSCTLTLMPNFPVAPSGGIFDVLFEMKFSNGQPGQVPVPVLFQYVNDLQWLVFQQRLSASVDFTRVWAEYARVEGFGDDDNFWRPGLEGLYHLTRERASCRLRVEVEAPPAQNGATSCHAEYTAFKVGSQDDKYKLTLGDMDAQQSNCTDNMRMENPDNTDVNGMQFSTIDRDNDALAAHHCAHLYRGGWWYRGCHSANLNGEYGSTVYGRGINWKVPWTYTVSMTKAKMMLRCT